MDRLKANRSTANLLEQGLFPAVSADKERPYQGQISDYRGAATVLPDADLPIADNG